MTEKPEIGTELAKLEREPVAVAETSSTAVAAREKAAVEARFVMAMNRPRDPEEARQRILKACKRPRFAESARYQKPVGSGRVYGLSIRFAEEVARIWGNIYVQASIVFDDRERRIYHVVATDLETNTAQEQDVVVEKFIERRAVKQGDEIVSSRKNKAGETVYLKVATEDEILIKANAAISKARRNLILTLIPSDIREEAEEQSVETLKGRDKADPEAARKRLLDAFFGVGVSAGQVKQLIGKPLEQVNPAEMDVLRQAYTALKDGEATWAEISSDPFFNRSTPNGKATQDEGKGTAALNDKLKKKAETKVDVSDADELAAVEAEEEAAMRREEQGELGA